MNMLLLVVAVVACTALFLLWLAARLRAAEARRPWPYFAKKPLSPPEQVLYFRLVEALPEHIVLAQVQLSRVLGVRQKGREHRAWLNRIDRLSADFVVCRKDASVLVAIELDDATHRRAARRKTDARKDRALTSAGIPVLRWIVADIPDAAGIRAAMPAAAPVARPLETGSHGARARIEPFIGETVVTPLPDGAKRKHR